MYVSEVRDVARKYNFKLTKRRVGKNCYYCRKDDIEIVLSFNNNRVNSSFQNRKKSFSKLIDLECFLINVSNSEKENKEKNKPKVINDINQILFFEKGDELYYITRDLKVLKKLYKQTNDFNFVLIPVELSEDDLKMVSRLNLKFIWNDKVGYWEKEREQRILGGF